MRGRQGAAGIRMASRTAAANAFMRHKDLNAAAHGQPEPPPTASFEQQPWPCLSAAPGAEDRAAPQLEEQVHRVGVPRPAGRRSLHGSTCRAERAWENIGKCRAEEGVLPARVRMLAHQ